MYSQMQLEQLLNSADKEWLYESLFLNFDEDKIPELISILYTGSALDMLSILLDREPGEALDFIEELLQICFENNEEHSEPIS